MYFSHYLMRCVKGDGDTERSGMIIAGEKHAFLAENVAGRLACKMEFSSHN
jgi:hypothetical protein